MMKENGKSITTQVLSNRKILLYIILALAILVDGFITYDLLFNAKVALQYAIIPLIMLVVDVGYFVCSFFTNYRFKYSITGIIVYLGVITSGSLACLGLYSWNPSNVVMTTFSWVSFLLIHLIILIGLIYSVIVAKTYYKKNVTVPVIIGSVLSVIFSLTFFSIVQVNGAFGQIYIEEGRMISYEYDENKDGYIVNDVLKGRGNTITVPDKFNDKEIVGFNFQTLLDNQIKVVHFEKGNENIVFTNSDAINSNLDHLNNIKFLVDKNEINSLRKSLIDSIPQTLLTELRKDNIIELSNNIYPENINDSELYISFEYDYDSYLDSKGQILDSIIMEKGSKLTLKNLEYLDYVKYSNINNEEDLCWNYENNNKKIMNPLVDSSNNSIFDIPLTNDLIDVQVKFKDVYKISIQNDNDNLYEIDDSYKMTNCLNTTYNYRYSLLENAQDVLDSIPQREGFSLSWKEGSNEVTNLSSYLSSKGNGSTWKLSPLWSLNTPNITSISTNDVDNSFIYGEDVLLSCAHDEIASGIKYLYEWKNTSVSGETYEVKNPTISNALPLQSGNYQLKVTAYSDTITSLTSSSTEFINVNIEKRDLDFIWSSPLDLVYNGETKEVTCIHNVEQVINNDSITYLTRNNTYVDAGNYTANVTLTGDCASKYKIPSTTKTYNFNIIKRPVSVVWDTNKTFTYDGLEHNVSVSSIVNFVNNEENDILSSLEYTNKVNAGNHQQKVYLNHNNYYFEDEQTCDFEILKRDMTITFSPYSKIYDGQITSTSEYEYTCSNIASTDSLEQILTIKYLGDAVSAKDVGTYNFSPSYDGGKLINNYNVIINDTDGVLEITKRSISFNWDYNSFVYNGKEQHPNVITITNSISDEENDIIDSLIYSEGKVNVGSNYLIEAELSPSMSKNYSLIESSKNYLYKITKKDLTINVGNVTKTYDSLPHENFAYTINGIVGDDLEEEIFTSNFYGTAIDAFNVGSYTIDLSLTEQAKYNNYNIIKNTGTLIINKRDITLLWTNDNSYIYDGMEKSITVTGVEGAVIGEEDSLISSIQYGNGNIHVGTHTQICNLTSTFANNYNVINNSNKHTYIINPKDAKIIIDSKSKEYDGTVLTDFTHTVYGLATSDSADDIFTYVYSGEATTNSNAGTNYEIDIVLTSKEVDSYGKTYQKLNDYNFTITKGTGTITPREISFVWDDNISYVYNGTIQGVKVISIDRVLLKDSVSILKSITYNDGNIDVGNYRREASLINNNYVVNETSRFKNYEITKKALTITIQSFTHTYNGSSVNDYSFSTSGKIYTDSQEDIFSLTYTGDAVGAVNAGSYTINAECNEGKKYNNYSITIVPGTLIIDPKPVSAIWSSTTRLEYNGDSQGVEVIGFNNASESEKGLLLASLSYNDGNIDVNSEGYVREVTSSNKNYILSNTTCKYYIISRSLTIRITNATKVYDGNTYSGFSYTTENLVLGDNINDILTLTYTGPGVSAVNVGTYLVSANYSLHTDKLGKNYSINIVNGYLTINPKEISLVWDTNNTFEYSGESFGIEVKGVTGIIGNVEDFILEITYNAKQYQVGTYTRIAYINNDNYVVKDGSNMMTYYITSNPLS